MSVSGESGPEDRDEAADERDLSADVRDKAARRRDRVAEQRDVDARMRDRAAVEEEGPELTIPDTESLREFVVHLRGYQAAVAADRRAAAQDRRAAADDRRSAVADRRAAARDRELASWARQQAAVEAAEERPMQRPHPPPASPAAAPEIPDPATPRQHAHHALIVALRAATQRESQALESARHAARLAVEVAGSEERLAETLQTASLGTDEAAQERRRGLAAEATQGADVAMQRGERLQELAETVADHLEASTRRTLLTYASKAFTDLAQAEHTIAKALELLAAHSEGETSDGYTREAQQSAAAAEHASTRARELHGLPKPLTDEQAGD